MKVKRMTYRTTPYDGEKTWACFYCGSLYPNTLLFCPKCSIAKKHSNNLYESHKEKRKKFIK